MKSKLLCLFSLLLFCSIVSSCKEEEDAIPSIEQRLTGKWATTLIRIQFYDSSGILDMEQLIPTSYTQGNGVTLSFDGKGGYIADYPHHPSNHGNYSITKKDGKNYVTLYDGGIDGEYEILTLTNKQLVLQVNHYTLTYSDGSQSKTASKSFSVMECSKQ